VAGQFVQCLAFSRWPAPSTFTRRKTSPAYVANLLVVFSLIVHQMLHFCQEVLCRTCETVTKRCFRYAYDSDSVVFVFLLLQAETPAPPVIPNYLHVFTLPNRDTGLHPQLSICNIAVLYNGVYVESDVPTRCQALKPSIRPVHPRRRPSFQRSR
jgi:hypothetical protein